MALRRSAIPFLVFVLASLSTPWRTAHAWTEAGVTSVRADVGVRSDGHVHVRLDLAVGVRGGVLRELEVAGLEPDLVLDGTVRPSLVSDTGQAFETSVSVDPSGKVLLGFPGRDGPHRGNYQVALAYDAALPRDRIRPLESGGVRYTFVLPGWQTGLDGVVVTLTAPEGATLAESDLPTSSFAQVRREDTPRGPRFELRRAHLARTMTWPVSFDLPQGNVPAELRSEPTRPVRAALRGAQGQVSESKALYVLALVFALVALVKRHAFVREARRRDAHTSPLVPFVRHGAAHAALVLGASAVAARAGHACPELAFGALALVVLASIERLPKRERASRLGGFRAATHADLALARREALRGRFALLSLVDAREPLGLLVLTAIAALVVKLELAAPAASRDTVFTAWHGLVLLVGLFAVSSRASLPSTPLERLDALRRIAGRLRAPLSADAPIAIRLALHCDARGDIQDARIRLATPHRASGLVRLDLVLVDRATLGGYERLPSWLFVVRAASEADRLLGAESLRARTAPGGRRARLLPFDRRAFETIARLTKSTETTPAVATNETHTETTEAQLFAAPSHVLQ